MGSKIAKFDFKFIIKINIFKYFLFLYRICNLVFSLLDEECSKIMFSLQMGLRIALNREGKRAKHELKPIRRASVWDPTNPVQINT